MGSGHGTRGHARPGSRPARRDARLRKSRQQLLSFLLRHGRVHSGKAWTRTHRHWLTTLRFDHPAQRIVFQDYMHAVQDAEKRRDALTGQIRELIPEWSMAPVVTALQALRGMAMVTAVTLGRRSRGSHPIRQPARSDVASGAGALRALERRNDPSRRHHQDREFRGAPGHGGGRLDLSIAGTGGSHSARPARRTAYGDPQHRLESSDTALCPLSTAGCQGKPIPLVIAAIARELLGFAWAIASHVGPIEATA